MPNWCSNKLTIFHPDPKMMEKAVNAWNEGKFLSTLVPEPDYPGYTDCTIKDGMPDWWEWRVANWGTKWDVGHDPNVGNKGELHNGEMSVMFDSAWAPPVNAYDSMTQQGFEITAYYFEPGCDFCGKYSNGEDECYSVSDKNFPEDIDDEMDISESMQE